MLKDRKKDQYVLEYNERQKEGNVFKDIQRKRIRYIKGIDGENQLY